MLRKQWVALIDGIITLMTDKHTNDSVHTLILPHLYCALRVGVCIVKASNTFGMSSATLSSDTIFMLDIGACYLSHTVGLCSSSFELNMFRGCPCVCHPHVFGLRSMFLFLLQNKWDNVVVSPQFATFIELIPGLSLGEVPSSGISPEFAGSLFPVCIFALRETSCNLQSLQIIKCPQSHCVFRRQFGAYSVGIYEGYAMLVAWRLVCPTVR